MDKRLYVAIDLKSFYASVECIERGLDPITTNLVVADKSRTEKTICLAVTPSLKAYGIHGRARLFEVVQKIKEVNGKRRIESPRKRLVGKSFNSNELEANSELEVDYLVATPQMARYIECSTQIYQIYLRYVAPEDMHVYSIDEVFMDITRYLKSSKLSAHDFVVKIVLEVLNETGITATAGMGTNLYLCKVAMDIEAKHIKPDENGVRIAYLDEMKYRQSLWTHRPITDFWRVGKGYAKKLEEHGIYTMGDIARCSKGKQNEFYNEELLYKLFGVNAELLIDHAWGWEPCTMAEVKEYKPSTNSIGSGQVLQHPYSFEKAKLVVREMADVLVLDLVDKGLMTNQIILTVGYDIDNFKDEKKMKSYRGVVNTDWYGRKVPKHAHGTVNLDKYTSSTKQIMEALTELFENIVDKNLLVRRMYVTANKVVSEMTIAKENAPRQLDLFTDYEAVLRKEKDEASELEKEKKIQKAILSIKKKYGKNAVLRGMNFEEGGTTKNRNNQIGGHKA